MPDAAISFHVPLDFYISFGLSILFINLWTGTGVHNFYGFIIHKFPIMILNYFVYIHISFIVKVKFIRAKCEKFALGQYISIGLIDKQFLEMVCGDNEYIAIGS